MSTRHQQVADDLRRLIGSGVWVPGRRLPPESELATRYRVSTPTLREALQVLRAEGLIEKFQGRGNFVRHPVPRLIYPGGAAGLHVIVSSFAVTAAGPLATHLRIRPDAQLAQYVYLSHRGDEPQTLAHIYVPEALARRLVVRPAGSSPWGEDLLDQLAAVGLPTISTSDQVTARYPTAAEAQSLRIAPRSPVLAVERTTTTSDGLVVIFSHLVLPVDRTAIAFRDGDLRQEHPR
jgi:GntR family transcriptional regulator